MAGEQSLDRMGGFRKAMPFTYGCFLIGGLALSGVPPFSGFFSKDEILLDTGERGGWHWALYGIGYLAACLTAIYTFRMIFRAFHGEPVAEARELEEGHQHHAAAPFNPANGEQEDLDVGFPGPTHAIAERAWPMAVAMGVLAVGAILAGIVQIPKVDDVITDFLRGSFERTSDYEEPTKEGLLVFGLGLGTVLALVGIAIAHRMWVVRPGTSDARARAPGAAVRAAEPRLVLRRADRRARGAPDGGRGRVREEHLRAHVRRRDADRRHHRDRARRLGRGARRAERLRALLRRAVDRRRGGRGLLLPAAELTMAPLSIMLWLPAASGLLGALAALRPAGARRARGCRRPSRWSARSAPSACRSSYIAQYKPGGGLQDVTDVVWIAELGIHYKLALTGLNLFLLALTTLLFAVAVFAATLRTWERPRLFYFNLMLAESAVLGAFLAQDLALFVAFFDLMLVPFYFLTGGWGREPGRVRATIKLVIYTLVGSLLMLAGAVATGVIASEHSRPAHHLRALLAAVDGPAERLAGVDLPVLRRRLPGEDAGLPAARLDARRLPRDADRGADGLLGGALEGGRLRLSGDRAAADARTPSVHYQTLMLVIALASILYGSAQAFSQTDARLIAGYSSVAQLGFITLGDLRAERPGRPRGRCCRWSTTASWSARCCSSWRCSRAAREARRTSARWAGIAFRAPVLASLFLIVTLATLAIPGSANFIGEFLILLGVFNAKLVIAIIAFSGRRAGERVRAAAVHQRDAQPRRPRRWTRTRSRCARAWCWRR